MKSVVFASLFAGALAFAPSSQKQASSSALQAKDPFRYENELGVIAPTGFFDPLGLSADLTQEQFDAYRASELKHGRVCMLGIIGYVTQEVTRFPGDVAPGLKFADVPNGLKAIDAIPALGWLQIFFLIGAVDYYGYFFYPQTNPKLDEEEFERRQLSELTHGRLAMLAFLELIRHDAHNIVNPGMDYGYTDLITGFPFLYNPVLSGSV